MPLFFDCRYLFNFFMSKNEKKKAPVNFFKKLYLRLRAYSALKSSQITLVESARPFSGPLVFYSIFFIHVRGRVSAPLGAERTVFFFSIH
jgi:hypothetical protein